MPANLLHKLKKHRRQPTCIGRDPSRKSSASTCNDLMREFADIERDLHLIKFTGSRNGTLYCVPVAPRAPRLIVRRFDQELPPSLVTTYARLIADAAAWIVADPELAKLVRIEQPTEIGSDYIARRHVNATSLAAFLAIDPEEDPPEAPPELSRMQARFHERTKLVSNAREALLASILARSILEPSQKTFYDFEAEQFLIADPAPTRDDLERWTALCP
jgi:hypothetical protein